MEEAPNPKTFLPAVIISLVVFGGVYMAYVSAKSRPSTIVLPGGITYLGETPTPAIAPTALTEQATLGIIPIPANTTWTTYRGKQFPYSFSYPSSLSLGVFPNDPYDSVTIFYGSTDPSKNIFFRVEDLTKLKKTAYVGKPLEYAKQWWKDYAWKGVQTVTAIQNNQGLTGYRAVYLDDTHGPSRDQIFFVVPGNDNLIIWLSGNLFAPDIFNRIVDSVAWTKK